MYPVMRENVMRITAGMFVALLLLAACQPDEVKPELPTVIPTAVASQPTTTPQPIPTIQPLPTNTPPPTAVPLTSTAPAPIAIALPPEWETVVTAALTQLDNQQWQILPSDAPLDALGSGQAQIALSNGDAGSLVYQEPVVLAVPFFTPWEAVTLVEAEEILANGRNDVTILTWDEMTPDMKALRVDGLHPTDAAYPLQKRLTLTAVPEAQTAAANLTAALQTALAPEPDVKVTAVGDIMLARLLGELIEQGKLEFPFAPVAPHLQNADLTIGNMESALGTLGQPEDKVYTFRAPPEAAQSLALAGFDVVSLANNHALDYGPEALLQGIDLLNAANVAPVGAGADYAAAHQPYLTEINGLKLAVLGYVNVGMEGSPPYFVTESWTATETTPGVAWANPEEIMADVTAVHDQTDLVIVILHSGLEYVEQPGPEQIAAAYAAIDAGADIVIGHHPHILQGIEYYKDGVIVYSLGNFAFQIDGDPGTAILNVWLDKDGVHSMELIPALVQESGQPRLATEEEAEPIRQWVYFLSRFLPVENLGD